MVSHEPITTNTPSTLRLDTHTSVCATKRQIPSCEKLSTVLNKVCFFIRLGLG